MQSTQESKLHVRTAEGGKHLTGGRAVARALIENGVTDLFGIHGYINSVVEETCRLGARMWHFRHEQSAGFAADAYARVLRRPGVCFASASAGMANYLGALSQGIGALSPIVLLVGQHGTAGDRLGILQEGYATECFKSVAKWTHRCTDWELNSFWVRKALYDSMTYPPGPVVLEFPLNNLWSQGPQPQRKYAPSAGLPAIPATQADPTLVASAATLLIDAERPLLIAGDGLYWSDGVGEFRALAEFLKIPASGRRTARGAVAEDHPLGFSSGYRKRLFDQADVICLVGLRASELESWFEAPDWPRNAKYIQINETPGEMWHGLAADVNIVGTGKLVLRQLLSAVSASQGDKPIQRTAWLHTLDEARTKYFHRRAQVTSEHQRTEKIHTHELCCAIADCIDEDATIIYDSYSGSLYLTDAIKAKFPGQILDAGPRVALGQGTGMVFGAGIARPGKQIVTLIGDGGIGLSGMDMDTLVRYGVPALVIVLNNSSWGGNSLSRADLQPDIGSWDMMPGLRYDKVFEPLGCHIEHVEKRSELRGALKRALASGKPALVNVVADTEGTGVSAPWLRLKIGEFYSRGLDDLPQSVRSHFRAVSLMDALRLHKSAADNGTQIPMDFIARLTGHSEENLRALATTTGYVY